VREHGLEYSADPTVIFAAGSSAGGNPALLAALTPNQPAFQPGSSARTPLAPPIFLAHGDQDTYVPVESARFMAERLRSRSTEPVVYAELPGGQHSFDLFHSIRFEEVVYGVEAFTAWVISRPPPDV
jgi:acetyl esterase/lipase